MLIKPREVALAVQRESQELGSAKTGEQVRPPFPNSVYGKPQREAAVLLAGRVADGPAKSLNPSYAIRGMKVIENRLLGLLLEGEKQAWIGKIPIGKLEDSVLSENFCAQGRETVREQKFFCLFRGKSRELGN